jgi:hypothetical protein
MRRSLLLTVPLLVVASSCIGVNPAGPDNSRGGIGTPGGGTGDPADFSFSDPAGDTLTVASNEMPRALDVLGLDGAVGTDTLTLTITFALPVTPWSEGGVGALDGFIDLDMDENSETGVVSAVDLAGGNSGIGADLYISLRDFITNRATLVNVSDESFVAIPIAFDGTTVTIRIPRDKLGEEEDGSFFMNAVVGTTDREVTDMLPNTGFYTVRPF